MGCPLSCFPIWGTKDRGGPLQATFPFPLLGWQSKERAGEHVLSVRESLQDKYFVLRSKWEK
jgi:hypothetical protein